VTGVSSGATGVGAKMTAPPLHALRVMRMTRKISTRFIKVKYSVPYAQKTRGAEARKFAVTFCLLIRYSYKMAFSR
jgi:hypothetical protein